MMAFLDVMACGLGAAILLFLIVKHHTGTAVEPDTGERAAAGEETLAALRREAGTLAGRIEEAQRRSRNATTGRPRPAARAGKTPAGRGSPKSSARIRDARARNAALRNEVESIDPDQAGDVIEDVRGGEEEYLLGLRVEGRRIAILLDRSASMTDERLIDVIARKVRSDAEKKQGPKWRRTLRTARWLLHRLPAGSEVAVIAFNDQATVLHGAAWADGRDRAALRGLFGELDRLVPTGATNLEAGLQALGRLSPAATDVYVVTDGLPTRSLSSARTALRLLREREGQGERRLPQGAVLREPASVRPAAGPEGPRHPAAAGRGSGSVAGVLELDRAGRRAPHDPGEGLAVKKARSSGEVFGLAFLDVITCGFGAIVLLLLISRPAPIDAGGDARAPVPESEIREAADLVARLRERWDALRSALADEAERRPAPVETPGEDPALDKAIRAAGRKLEQLQRDNQGLERIRESLRRATLRVRAPVSERDPEVGGIPVDSEYVIFIVDTSGSMKSIWDRVMEVMDQVLDVHPRVSGFQVLNDNGGYLVSAYRRKWIPDTPRRRRSILDLVRNWGAFSNSSPVEGSRPRYAPTRGRTGRSPSTSSATTTPDRPTTRSSRRCGSSTPSRGPAGAGSASTPSASSPPTAPNATRPSCAR